MRQSRIDKKKDVVKCLSVVDLFCGAGGFSCGAVMAGHRVVYACDAEEEALAVHALNHPCCKHECLNLPAPIPFPKGEFHIHGSPPCQKFSSICSKSRHDGDQEHAKSLVEWYLQTALTCGAASFSMEQVPSKHVIKIVERFRKAHPHTLAYDVFDFSMLGVPQTRKRLIAASPHLLRRLMIRRAECPRRSVADVIDQPRGTHIRNTNYTARARKRDSPNGTKYIYEKARRNDHCHSIHGPSPTILAAVGLFWIKDRSNDSEIWSVLHIKESAALQTFPPYYQFEGIKRLQQRHVGNAVPPLVAQTLLGTVERCSSPSLF